MTGPSFAPLLERFFIQRLMRQRQASPHTISSYRDTFRQLLKFTQQRLHKAPSQLMFEELDAPLIVAFPEHLQQHHGLGGSSAFVEERGIGDLHAGQVLHCVEDSLRTPDVASGAHTHVKLMAPPRRQAKGFVKGSDMHYPG